MVMYSRRYISLLLFVIIAAGIVLKGTVQYVNKSYAEANFKVGEAYYVSFDSELGSAGRRGATIYYQLQYEYVVNGEKYTATAELTHGKLPEEGSFIPIFYDPDNPEKYYLPVDESYETDIAIGLLLIAAAGVFLFLVRMKDGIRRRFTSVYGINKKK